MIFLNTIKEAIKKDIIAIKKKNYINEDFTVRQNREIKSGLIHFGKDLLLFLEDPTYDWDSNGIEKKINFIEMNGDVYYYYSINDLYESIIDNMDENKGSFCNQIHAVENLFLDVVDHNTTKDLSYLIGESIFLFQFDFAEPNDYIDHDGDVVENLVYENFDNVMKLRENEPLLSY